MEGWDYAQLTKKASEVGGPEALIRQMLSRAVFLLVQLS